MSTTNKFFTKRFYLDNPINRSINRGGDHFVGTSFKSFWVSGTNNSSFQATFVINPETDTSVGGLPLRLNQCQGFIESKAEDACIEVLVAQPGVWVDITFSQDELIQVGSVAVTIQGAVNIVDGNLHASALITVPTATAIEIFPADAARVKGTFQNKGATSIFVGNNTAAELTNASFQDICEEVAPGGVFEWKNKGSLFARAIDSAAKTSTRTEF